MPLKQANTKHSFVRKIKLTQAQRIKITLNLIPQKDLKDKTPQPKPLQKIDTRKRRIYPLSAAGQAT